MQSIFLINQQRRGAITTTLLPDGSAGVVVLVTSNKYPMPQWEEREEGVTARASTMVRRHGFQI